MSPAPKTRQLLLDKCRFKYSWAAGVTRGTTSAIEWQKRDLETAFAEIDGLMAGLHYQDKAENNMTQAESPMQSPSGLVHASVFDTQQYPTDILDKDLLGDTADGYTATAEPIPGTEHQPMAPQWAAIRSLRDETAFHHKRFQLVARSLDNPIISKLLSVYPDARSIRNKGAQLVKDVLEGFQPRELPLLFAFASFSYAISQLLYKKGHIDRGDILADLRTWRDLISDPSERQAFSLLAQELWPEAKDRLHFLPMPPRSSAAPFPNPPPGEAILAGTAEFAAPVFPYFPANGQVTEDRNVDLYPSDPFGLDNTTSQSALDSDLVPNLVELFNGTHATFDFAAINSFDNQPYRQPPSCTSWSQSNGLDPPGCPRVQKRTGDTPGVEREQLPSVNGESKEVKLADTGMFLVILVFLQDIGELLYILSGRSLPSRRCKLYKAEEEDQKVFYKSAQKAFFKPRYQCQNSNLPTFLAILSVAETFTKSGFLRSIAEIKHYLASVATAVIPPGALFEQFLSSVLHDASVSSQTSQPNQREKRRRSLDAEDLSPETTLSSRDTKRSRKCGYEGCDASYGDRGALRKHRIQIHVKPPPIRCGECDYGNPRRDRVRSHFLRKHPDTVLPESLKERGRAVSLQTGLG